MGGENAESPVAVTEGCPAFADGCPYGKNVEVADWIKEKREDALDACPAFKDGCPFDGAADMAQLQSKLEGLPPSHGKAEEGGKSHEMLLEMLKTVHKASQSMKQTVGAECPVFQEACPFKNCTTSQGTPLALELETRSWGLWIQEAEAAEAEDCADGLAKKLKEGTADAHKAAESVHFVKEFIKCRVDQQIYAQFVVNLYHIYQALEEALDANAEHPLVESLHFPDELERAETLKLDAEYYLGSNWQQETLPSKVTREYVQRLQQLQKEAPELLIPHAYTRYLGDLSGGQLLKKAAIRGMKLPADGSGVHFYNFRRIPDTMVFKNMYRARMDSLHADSATADRMVEEANYAFFLNTRIFQELDSLAGFEANPVPPPVTAPASSEAAQAYSAAKAAGCPFASLAAQGLPLPEGHPSSTEKSAEPEPKEESTAHQPPVKPQAAKMPWLQITGAVAVLGLIVALRASRSK